MRSPTRRTTLCGRLGGHPGAAHQRLAAFIGAWRAAGRPFEVVLRFAELDVNVAEREAFVAQWAVCGATIVLKSHLRFPDVPAELDLDRAAAAAAAVLFAGPESVRTRQMRPPLVQQRW
jgi:hypothetical protein